MPRALSVVERRQEALDHCRVFDGSDDLHLPVTGLDVDLEHALQTLRPCRCGAALCPRLIRAHRVTLPASGRGHLLTQMMVGREDAVRTGEIDARAGHECRRPGDEIQGVEDDMRGAIPVRRLQSGVDEPLGGEREGSSTFVNADRFDARCFTGDITRPSSTGARDDKATDTSTRRPNASRNFCVIQRCKVLHRRANPATGAR